MLASDDGSIQQLSPKRDAFLRADGRQDLGALGNASYPRKQEDGSFQRTEEEPRPGKEEVSCELADGCGQAMLNESLSAG